MITLEKLRMLLPKVPKYRVITDTMALVATYKMVQNVHGSICLNVWAPLVFHPALLNE